jgi:mycoredoxin-dependent peroxiredoxin
MSIEVGQQAPDFTLRDQDGNEVTLSSFSGERPVVLVFVPFAFTPVCQGELCELRDDLPAFEQAGVQLLGITCDRQFSNKAWSEQQGFNFPILSDGWPHGAVAQAYGAFNEALGCANRRTVIIDRDGVIVDIFETDNLRTPRDQEQYQEALSSLAA